MSAAATINAGKLLTAEELAERWNLPGKRPAQAIWRMTRDGTIPPGAAVRLGRYYRYRLAGIEEFEAAGGAIGGGDAA